jgi:hypothetical protein
MIPAMGDSGTAILAAGAPDERRHAPTAVAVSVRWICFLILLASTLLALPARFPPTTDFTRLLYDVQHGNTSAVIIENLTPGQASGGNARARWQTGPVSWHEADVPFLPSAPAQSTLEEHLLNFSGDGLTYVMKQRYWATAQDEASVLVEQMATDSHRSVEQRITSTHNPPGVHLSFTDPAVPEPLMVITGALWLATFLGMLFTGGHPYANRWAWFWLFVVGGVGPMLILWKEPTPLRVRFWRRDPGPRPQPPRRPMTGGVGLLTAIGWTIVLTGAAFVVGWASSAR